jgi:hypothetical protein
MPRRHCEEQSDEAIQRARSAQNKNRGNCSERCFFCLARVARAGLLASLAMTSWLRQPRRLMKHQQFQTVMVNALLSVVR